MRQGTTPTIVINVNNIDLSELKSVYITFEQDGYLLRKVTFFLQEILTKLKTFKNQSYTFAKTI